MEVLKFSRTTNVQFREENVSQYFHFIVLIVEQDENGDFSAVMSSETRPSMVIYLSSGSGGVI